MSSGRWRVVVPSAAQRPAREPDSLWRGRVLLILGSILLGITLRHDVTGAVVFFVLSIMALFGMGLATL